MTFALVKQAFDVFHLGEPECRQQRIVGAGAFFADVRGALQIFGGFVELAQHRVDTSEVGHKAKNLGTAGTEMLFFGLKSTKEEGLA